MTIITELLTRWEFYLSIFGIYVISRIIRWLADPLRKIPGPRGYPIIGNTFDYSLGKDFHQVLLERAKIYGKIYKDYSVFGGTSVFITDPEYAKQVLVTKSMNYDRGDVLLSFLPALGTGLLTTGGKEHAIMRKNLNPAFTLGSVKEFISTFNMKASQLVKCIEEGIQDNNGKPIEIRMLQKFTDLTLDVIGICAFGYDFNCVIGGTSDESQASNTILSANFNMVRRSFEELIPLLKLIPSKEREDLKKAEDLFYGLIKKVIAARREEMASHPGETMEKPDLLQKLISMYEEAGLSISNKDLFHQVFTFMLAGHETTSLSMTWFIFLLATYQKYQPKIQNEIKEVLGDRSEVTFEDLDKLPALDNCIKETMRVYPAVLFTGRGCVKEDKIGPYTIPPKTKLLINIGCLGRNPKSWDNPDEFDPDRFSRVGEKDPLFPYYYMPFARGARMCIGYRFALMEMKVVLAQLLKHFSFKLAKSQSPNIKGLQVLTYRPDPAPLIEISKV